MLCWGGERSRMKLKDKELERQRETERELERANGRTEDNPLSSEDQPEIIEHFLHPHPLIYYESDYASFTCNGCRGNGQGSRFHCAQCNFDLHKICAETPLTWLSHYMRPDEVEVSGFQFEVIETFAHPQHLVMSEYRRRSFCCDHCKNYGDGVRFFCEPCNVRFHQVCAKHPTRLTSSHMHPEHELELKLRPYFRKCSFCQTAGPGSNRMYRCKECDFYVHPGCSQWPLFLINPLHPPHPLKLIPGRDDQPYTCSSCRGQMQGYKYGCKVCGLYFDPRCIRQQARLGQGDQLRESYGGVLQLTTLSITNLYLPETAFPGLPDRQLQSPAVRALGSVNPLISLSLDL